MKKLYFLMAMIFAFSIMGGTALAQEIMLNGDLELWDDPSTPTSWTKAENTSQESTTIHGGTYSAGHTSADGTKDLQQDITGVVGGANYTISYYFLDNSTSARTRIWSYWLSGGSTIPDNEDELRPSTYSEDSPDWQHVTFDLTAPAGADGFRFEVRVYKQDGASGGMVYYDDFSVMSAGILPEPTNYPTDFVATASGISVNLDWIDAIGAQLPSAYLVMASTEDNITAPVDGMAVADDIDLSDGSGALNIGFGAETCSFGNLTVNTPYFFAIYPYTNGGADIDFKIDGTAPAASATTPDMSIIESENFDDGWGDWQSVSIVGDLEWVIDPVNGMNGTPCAKCTGFDGSPNANEDWLISPALNLDNYSSEVLSFYTADAYDGPALEALISTDYDGSDPTTATWDPLTFETSTGFFDWISSGDIDISAYNGSAVYIAFKFTSTGAESATWEVDDILITGAGGTGIGEGSAFSAEISYYPNPAVNTLNVSTAKGEVVNLQIFSLLGAKVSGDITVSGTTSLDLGDMTDGIYILHFTDEYGNSRNEKLIIEK